MFVGFMEGFMKGLKVRVVGVVFVSFVFVGVVAVFALVVFGVIVGLVSSFVVGAKVGMFYGVVVNRGGRVVDVKVGVRIQCIGGVVEFVGHIVVCVLVGGLACYTVVVCLFGGLSCGNYYLVVCTLLGIGVGDFGCAMFERDIVVKGGMFVCGVNAQLLVACIGVWVAVAEDCMFGVHTLVVFGDCVYLDVGNGGYVSVHSDVHINYDVFVNQFLVGMYVDL